MIHCSFFILTIIISVLWVYKFNPCIGLVEKVATTKALAKGLNQKTFKKGNFYHSKKVIISII